MHVRNLLIATMAACGLAACGAPESAPAPTPQQSAETAPNLRFVGLWGADAAQCADPAWRFAADEVSTRGEVHCAFTEVSQSGARYAIRAMCTAEAPPAPYDITLEVSENPRALVVAGGPWAEPIRLVYCAPHPEE